MMWLFGQLWFLMLLAFVVGSLVTWIVAKMLLPHEDELEAETGTTAEGIWR